eukprot:TRINITY_DN12471_c0_g4_i2.p1 TRINITY_DN12471_c0_g4~~TRINITY_DN12471_c0_g4_i2.p1  ORF type:complete len:296 (+),score=40.65 TRINITY_DN12471_c0_g4_i2:369-1256(+)
MIEKGEPSFGIYFILRGSVKVSRKEYGFFTKLSEGDFFGDFYMAESSSSLFYSVSEEEPMKGFYVPKQILDVLNNDYPDDYQILKQKAFLRIEAFKQRTVGKPRLKRKSISPQIRSPNRRRTGRFGAPIPIMIKRPRKISNDDRDHGSRKDAGNPNEPREKTPSHKDTPHPLFRNSIRPEADPDLEDLPPFDNQEDDYVPDMISEAELSHHLSESCTSIVEEDEEENGNPDDNESLDNSLDYDINRYPVAPKDFNEIDNLIKDLQIRVKHAKNSFDETKNKVLNSIVFIQHLFEK